VSDLDAEGPLQGRVDTILVAVSPPDGAAITAALRERGFAVVDAPLSVLRVRALGDPPRVMIVDLDPPGALEAVERAREASPSSELLCVGDPARAAELGMSRADGRCFERPIDLESMVLAVTALAEPALDLRAYGAASSLFASARETMPPVGARESEAPPPSEYPSTSDPLDIAAILPAFDDAAGFAASAAMELSPELQALLSAAEQRMNAVGEVHHSSIPSPDDDSDQLLPAELLASLDEPLDPEDEAAGGGPSTGDGTGYPKPRTTGERTPFATPTPTTAGVALEKVTGVDTTAGRSAAPPAPPSYAPEPLAAPSAHAEELALDRTIDRTVAPSTPPAPRVEERAEPLRPQRAPAPAAPPPVVPPPAASQPASLALPAVLGEGDAVRALSMAIAGRASGALALGTEGALRRIVLHDGDVVTAASSAPEEALIAFLAGRGDVEREVAARLAGKLPAFGRHAGAALIAHGHLGQDDLWPVLRAHAEWILGRAIVTDEGTCELELEPPGRLKAEPNVFGGATGAEVLLEAIRRAIPPDLARRRLGGPTARLAEGPRTALLAECALQPEVEQLVRASAGRSVGELLDAAEPELADVLYALVALGVLEALAPTRGAEPERAGVDPLDEEALRQRVRARLTLVEDGDYFTLLGIPHGATAYEIKRAYLELRRAFEPGRVLTAATADLAADVRLVAEVLDEAYEILREPHRRERYRKAIEAGPP
jgi:hypothetical protein